MKKILLITLLALGLNPAHAAPPQPGDGGIVIGPPTDNPPPTASPDPTTSQPFVNFVDVTLTAGDGATIYYDENNSRTTFDPAHATTYDGTPLHLTASTAIRAQACYSGVAKISSGCSEIAFFNYTMDVPPTITMVKPTEGQLIRQGQNFTFTSANVTDPDGQGIASVHYYRSAPGTDVWEDLGAGDASYSLLWPPSGSGTYSMRAGAIDALGAIGYSAAVNVTVTPPNMSPSVVWNAPAAGSYLSPATFTLSVSPADSDAAGGGITKVEFYQNDTLLGFKDAAPWTWPLPAYNAGDFKFYAKAYDNNIPAATAASTPVTIKVRANIPPKVSITSPANNAFYYAPAADSIKVNVSDDDGTIKKVELYVGNTLDQIDSIPPFGFYKSGTAAGTYTLTAKAYDNLLASTVSAPVTIKVITNKPPIVSAGKDTVITLPTNSVVLKATATDPDSLPTAMTYQWTGPGAGTTFTNGNTLTPTVNLPGSGVYALVFKATDALGASATSTVNVTVWSKPSITSPTSASGAAGQQFSYPVTAIGFPTPKLNTTGRPTWLNWDSTSGTLSGKPPALGTYTTNMIATSAAGTDTKVLSISIGDSLTKPTITSALNVNGKLGAPFGFNVVAKGTSPITFAATSLPGGLAIAAATGNISGTPTASGSFSVGISAQNAYGSDAKTLAMTIKADPKITTDLPDTATVSEKGSRLFSVTATGFPAVSYQWEFAGASGVFGKIGTNAPTYSIDTASLSSGGKYRVTVTNDTGSITSKVCLVTIKPLPAPIVIKQNPGSATPTVGKPATFMVRATGAPVLLYQWFKGSTAVKSPPTSADSDLVFAAVKATDAGVYRARITNPYSDTTKPGTYAWSDTARLSVLAPKLFPPKATPGGGPYSKPTVVTLTNDTPGTSIYYTLNEAGEPTQASKLYVPGTTVITIDTNIVLRAKAYKTDFRASDMMVETYNYAKLGKVQRPTIRPPTLTFTSPVTCTLTTVTPSADIYYTLDGSSPLTGNPKKFSGSITLNATTTIIAFAKAPGMDSSDTVSQTYTYVPPKPKVATPTATPSGGDFSQQVKVTLATTTDTSVIWYTLDGTSPDSSKTKIQYTDAGFTLTKSATVRAIGLNSKFTKSDEASWKFNLIPLITANPPSGLVFDKEVNVKLSVSPANAVIRYTVDGTTPDAVTSPVFDTSAGLKFTGTTTLSAIAILDGISTKTSFFSYTLKYGQLATPSPVTVNNATVFKDSLKISLLATSGSDIYYTVNGSLPTTGSKLYKSPFIIDSTTTVQAIAVQAGFETSKILFATYTLVPESPVIKPVGGSYASAQKVTMTCSSKRAALFYTLDESAPTPTSGIVYRPGDSITISTTKTLKAIAVAGNMASKVRTESYNIFGGRDTVLHPGEIFYLEGGYTLVNPDAQSANVHIQLASADSLKLKGFDGVQYSITVAMADSQPFYPAPEFPKLVFTRSESEQRSLYKADPSGLIYFISGADTATILQGGTYFMGIDISPPVITNLGETIDARDSTQISFLVEDNVANLNFDLKRNDDTLRNLSNQSLTSPGRFSVKLKHPAGTLKSLNVKLIVSDYQLTSFYPKDSRTFHSLSQSLGVMRGPPLWAIGLNSRFPFDLISIPLALDPPLTLADLGRLSSDPKLQGVAWNNADTTYEPIPSTEVLKPGQAYWIGSLTRLSDLTMTAAKTSAQDSASFTIQLHHGWNQVGNPHLENLYWPVTRVLPDVYRSSPIKGLWGYNAATTDYEESEFLAPWRGYYVFNYLQDTTIQLSTQPNISGALNKAGIPRPGVAADEINMTMGWGAAKTLRLGAAWTAQDGLGMEDEMELPHDQGMTYLKAVRSGKSLSSDWIHLVRDGIMQWKVAMGGIGDSLPPLRILDQDLPAGYETWAVSRSRSMKFKLEAGQSVSASGLAQDTLFIYTGPAELLAKLSALKGMALHAPDLKLTVLAQSGGFALQLALPAQARINAAVWGMDGTRKGEFHVGPLSEGSYRFAYGSDFQGRSRSLPPGIYFLTLELQGTGPNALHTRLNRKIVLGD